MDVMGQLNAQNALTLSNNPQHMKLGGPHSIHVRGDETISALIGKRTSCDQLQRWYVTTYATPGNVQAGQLQSTAGPRSS